MKRGITIAALAGFGLGGLVAAFTYFAWPLMTGGGALGVPNHPVWTEARWPFAKDEWGQGKAFRCGAADCGVEVNLYIRAKIGFCNCTTGVSDDDELARLSDFSLLGEKLLAAGPGRPITVRWMKGRSRGYAVANSGWTQTSAITVAFNDRCDAIVATVLVGHQRPLVIEPSVIDFLNSKTISDWAEVAIGL